MMVFLFQADLGMGSAVVKFTAVARHLDPTIATRTLSSAVVWNVAVSVVAAAAYVPIALALLAASGSASVVSEQEATALVGIGTATLGFLAFRPFGNALQGLGYWSLERGLQLVAVGYRVVGTALVIAFSPNVVLIAAVEASALILPGILSAIIVSARKLSGFKLSAASRMTMREQLRFSIPAFSVNVVGSAVMQSGSVIIGLTVGPAAVSYWNAIFRVYGVLRQCLQWVIDPYMPRLSLLFATDEHSARRVYLGMTGLAAGAVACALPAAIYLSPSFLGLWLGPDAATPQLTLALQVLLGSVLVNSVHLPAITAVNAIGKPGVFLPIHLAWLILTVTAGVLATYPLGVLGMALAIAIPLLVLEPVYVWRASRVLSVRPGQIVAAALTRTSVLLLVAIAPILIFEMSFRQTNPAPITSWLIAALSVFLSFALYATRLVRKDHGNEGFAVRQRA
ncbi:O-antigen/teichoic acid export membrane protein [Microbacterium sp. AK009]|nr:O-antigen/teichoic acid export membrane protein [Microbacterium sp. AK009]